MEQHPQAAQGWPLQDLRQPAEFWQRLEARDHSAESGAARLSSQGIPQEPGPCRARTPEYRTVLKKPKGLGSLGRRRYLAFATWQGGKIAREAKVVVPSAYLWANGKRAGEGNAWLEKTVHSAVRCADPYYSVKRGWLVRRLGPDCSRIDIEELVHHEDRASLLFCMGRGEPPTSISAHPGRANASALFGSVCPRIGCKPAPTKCSSFVTKTGINSRPLPKRSS